MPRGGMMALPADDGVLMPKSKNARKKKSTRDVLSQAVDLKALEALQAVLGQLGASDDPHVDDALTAAQELVYDAWEARDRRRRIALAQEALQLSPDCADAYLLLGNEAKQPHEAMLLYRKAVEAGERALGDAFDELAGEFWGFMETRPYMRARHALALALWGAGEKEEAVRHYQDMLQLNPNDNQGIRYLLIDGLLALDRDDEATALLQQYEEDGSAEWAWSAALLAFRREGDCESSRAALAGACHVNRHVPAYLFGDRKLPRQLPDFISPGQQNEAAAYVHGAAEAWSAAAGALDWARSVMESKPKGPRGYSEQPQLQLDAVQNMRAGEEQIDDAVLALLLLGRHNGERVWKAFDSSAMHRLHQKGYITDPIGKQKSVVLTEEGLEKAEQRFRDLFPKAADFYL